MVVLDSTRRVAIVRRMLERGTDFAASVEPDGGSIGAGAALGAGLDVAEGAVVLAVPPAIAASTSFRTILPLGPVP
jgi:anti-sigma-K factor RskA